MCTDALFEGEVGILIERRELGEDLSKRSEFYWRTMGKQLHIWCRIYLATSARHEPRIAFHIRILLHVIEHSAHIIHLLLHIAWHGIPSTELCHPNRFAILLELLDIIFDCGRRSHIAVDSNSVDIIKRYIRQCKELIQPLDRVMIASKRAIVHSRRDEAEVQLFCQGYHLWPILSSLRRSHIALVGEIRFVEAQQVFGIRMLLYVLANLVCTV